MFVFGCRPVELIDDYCMLLENSQALLASAVLQHWFLFAVNTQRLPFHFPVPFKKITGNTRLCFVTCFTKIRNIKKSVDCLRSAWRRRRKNHPKGKTGCGRIPSPQMPLALPFYLSVSHQVSSCPLALWWALERLWCV